MSTRTDLENSASSKIASNNPMKDSIDLTGLRFGRLVVTRKSEERQNGLICWECHCDCGADIVAVGKNLKNGQKKSCGCLRSGLYLSESTCNKDKRKDYHVPRNNLAGRRFGRLVVVEQAENSTSRRGARWLCRCDCGNEIAVRADHLNNGVTKSCGCLSKDTNKASLNHITHGATRGGKWERLYVIWQGMKARCERSYATSYPNYGKRGISICDDWHDFELFRSWAMSNGYTDELTIDRIDNDGNYEPLNCRWATYKEQAANKRNRQSVQ